MVMFRSSSLGAALLVLLALAVSIQLARAAHKVEIKEPKHESDEDTEDSESNGMRRRATSRRIVSRLNLGANIDIKPKDSLLSAQGNKKRKYTETYKGYAVFNTGLDVEEEADGEISIVAGDVFADIEDDLGTTSHCDLSDANAKAIALAAFGLDESTVQKVVREAYENYVYVGDDNKARWVVDVELSLFKMDGKFSRPVVFIDACSGEVLDYFDRSGFYTVPPYDNDATSYGPGSSGSSDFLTDDPTDGFTDGSSDGFTDGSSDGFTGGPSDGSTDGSSHGPTNGPTKSPTNPPTKPPTQAPTNRPSGKCDVVDKAGNPKRVVEFGPGKEFCLSPMRRSKDGEMCYLENQYVKTVDLKGREDDSSTTIAKFKCSEGYDDEKNGGFSPVLDAFYFCTASSRLYREWYDYVTLNDPIPYAKAHYGKDYVNAYWDGRSMVFGDGDGVQYYPLTGLDTAAHELAHGVTEKASNLVYRGQSGGINEAFSDMAGEVTEEFLFGKSDMLSGAEMFIAPNQALRYFDDPTRDGSSIKLATDFRTGMDVHYSSGVYNHVFFLITKAIGIRASFNCFLAANRLYWRSDTNFEKGACGVIRGAYDAGLDMDVVAKAFKAVGLKLTECPNRATFITAKLQPGVIQNNLIVSDIINPLFKIEVPSGTRKVTISTPDMLNVALSSSYKRDDAPLSTGTGSVSADVAGGQVIYARFYRGVPTRISGASATLTFD